VQPWPHAEEPEVIKVGWRRLVRKVFVDPNGKKQEYYTKEDPKRPSVAIIALTPDNKVIVAEQFRPGPERIMQELPGGGGEDDEDLQAAAIRELHEETGYAVGTVESLGFVYKDAYTNPTSNYFLARDCVHDADQHTDEGEFINVKEITIDELFDNARNGHMTDSEGVFLAYEKLSAIRAGV
jgi:ADP-ribose pyrophosphatase